MLIAEFHLLNFLPVLGSVTELLAVCVCVCILYLISPPGQPVNSETREQDGN